ncbi:hypothetical protein VTK73DRAFT_440 [Phialemonium thermophilum]|uniref:Protein sip5 n=1 Tax=Phialemonium thermophilum TaxID=223376 RepID=A0ABR3XF64_9PEZI
MGNASTKESRPVDPGRRQSQSSQPVATNLDPNTAATQSDRSGPSNRRNRISRADLGGILGLSSPNSGSSRPSGVAERRETRQEREARRLEKERIARIKERERSLKEEHVDGGYLVTLGTYTGPEDFNKQIVRQLQIERKIAPFWRGLNDVDPNWTEHQIIAAARGLPIPPADEPPPEDLIPRPPPREQSSSTQNLNNLTVPIAGRSQSVASDNSSSNVGSALPSPVSAAPPRTSSPFKPRGKALAAVLGGGSSRNGSTSEIVPREINLPYDPFVNGQPIEVFLYKNATECPICFLAYPPYLNHTRCCDQPICSECFVQIKRPDPHYPEGHNENDPNRDPEETAGLLVSEPACCPYCTQPDFGVTYEPPPFRRGLAYSSSPSVIGSLNTAMSSTSSINSTTLSTTPGSPVGGPNRRRTQSVSASAPNVVLTDRIRPDWSTKLQAARAHQARRAAAATALHTAAFLMGSNSEARPFRVSRFGRRNTGASGSVPGTGEAGPGESGGASGADTPVTSAAEGTLLGASSRGSLAPNSTGTHRRSRMEDLEDMMFMEAVRLSLAAEEERKRKVEKEERKEAKRREKEARKAAKAAAKNSQGPYDGGRSGHSSASGSSLSLSGIGFGRKRGNSGASNLRAEASVANAIANTGGAEVPPSSSGRKDKGKSVDRGPENSEEPDASGEQCDAPSSVAGRSTTAPRPIPPLNAPRPSHLRQMSNASSVSSSLPDSQPGSYAAPSQLQDPRGSGLSLSGTSDDGGDADRDRDPSASTEPMFNYRSLAEVVGVTLEGKHAGRRLSVIEAERKANGDDKEEESSSSVHVEHQGGGRNLQDAKSVPDASPRRTEELATIGEDSTQELAQETTHQHHSHLSPPKVMVTPDTPGISDNDESKRLGYETTVERVQQLAQ